VIEWAGEEDGEVAFHIKDKDSTERLLGGYYRDKSTYRIHAWFTDTAETRTFDTAEEAVAYFEAIEELKEE